MYSISIKWNNDRYFLVGIVSHRYKILPLIKEYLRKMSVNRDPMTVELSDQVDCDRILKRLESDLKMGWDDFISRIYDKEENAYFGSFIINKIEIDEMISLELHDDTEQ